MINCHQQKNNIDSQDAQSSSLFRLSVKRFSKGATLIEYAVLIGLILVVALAAIQLLGQKISTQLSSLAQSV